jgi:hypothetical protein
LFAGPSTAALIVGGLGELQKLLFPRATAEQVDLDVASLLPRDVEHLARGPQLDAELTKALLALLALVQGAKLGAEELVQVVHGEIGRPAEPRVVDDEWPRRVPKTAKCSRVLTSIFSRLVETGAKEVSKR